MAQRRAFADLIISASLTSGTQTPLCPRTQNGPFGIPAPRLSFQNARFLRSFLRGCAYRRENRRRIEVNIPASGSLSTTPGIKVTAMATKPATAI